MVRVVVAIRSSSITCGILGLVTHVSVWRGRIDNRSENLARTFGVSSGTIRTASRATAGTYLAVQDAYLSHLADTAAADDVSAGDNDTDNDPVDYMTRPGAGIHCANTDPANGDSTAHLDRKHGISLKHGADSSGAGLYFDETQHVLTLGFIKGLPLGMQKSSWHVLVSQSEMFICWSRCADEGGDAADTVLDIVRPVVPLTGTDHRTIAHGLFEVPCSARLDTETMKTLRAAKIAAVLHFGRDGAGANTTMISKKMLDVASDERNKKVLMSDKVCSHHDNMVVKGAVTKRSGFPAVLSKMYTAAMAMKMGGNALRLVKCLPRVVDSMLQFKPGHPPAECREYAEQVIGCFASNAPLNTFRKAKDTASGRHRTCGDGRN